MEGRRPVRRVRGKCLDAVEREAMMFKCGNWKRLAEDREAWRWRIEDGRSRWAVAP
jgi:hypothetical protein